MPYKARLDPENGYLIGDFISDTATENGLSFRIDWLRGQKTGFFVDQRDNRALVGRYSHGRSVLNMFCYTGGFSVYALAGGARSVVSVDSSAKAISLTDANVALNFPGDTRHTSSAEDAFKYLDTMEKGVHDLIILDPPCVCEAPQRSAQRPSGISSPQCQAFDKIAPGGILFTFSCSQAVSKEQFRLAVSALPPRADAGCVFFISSLSRPIIR